MHVGGLAARLPLLGGGSESAMERMAITGSNLISEVPLAERTLCWEASRKLLGTFLVEPSR